MIDLDDARPILARLAAPTLTAFERAVAVCASERVHAKAHRADCDDSLLALKDGVDFWAYFASFLTPALADVPSARLIPGHPFAHGWLVADTFRVQLKSQVDALEVEQLVISGLADLEIGECALIGLSWEHEGVARFDPYFALLGASGVVWKQPVAALVQHEPKSVLRPPLPATRVKSKRALRKPDTQERRAGG